MHFEFCHWLHTIMMKLLSPITESTTHITHIDGLKSVHMILWKQIFSIVSLSMCGVV